MHDEPRPDATDPGDLTERHPIPPVAAAPDRAAPPPDAPAAPIGPETAATPVAPFGSVEPGAPVIEPYGARSSRTLPPTATRPRPSRVPTGRGRGTRPRRSRPNAGTSRRRPRHRWPPRRATGRGGRGGSILAAALLAAVLASGGTVLALGAAGALDRPSTPAPATTQGSNTGSTQPVAIDESSATIAVAAKVSPAVVTHHRHRQRPIPATSGSSRRPVSVPGSSSTATAGS